MSLVSTLVLTVVMLACLVAVPLGLPGLWIMLAVLLVPLLTGHYLFGVWLAFAAAVLVAELLEFLILKAVGKRFGASRRAFWAAVVGGILGAVVGVPLPVVGSLVGAFAGTFLGAGLVSYAETRSMDRAGRVGFGVVLARTLAVGLKIALGLVMIVFSAYLMLA